MKNRLLFALTALLLACSDREAPGATGAGGQGAAASSGAAGTATAGSSGSSGQAGAAGSPGGAGGVGPSGAGGSSGVAGSAGSSGVAGSSGNSGQAGAPACDGHLAAGVAVSPGDLYHYPPYAVDGCQLLYLAPVAGGAELRLRDLTDGSEQTLAAAVDRPIRPSLAGPVAAWEATDGGRQVVRVRSGGETRTVTGSFAQATEPRAAADAVVLTTWQGLTPDADTDIALFSVATGELTPVFTGPAQQRFADLSSTHVAFSDFAEDPDGTFDQDESDLADIVLFDRSTRQLDPHPLAGKQAFPQLGVDGAVVYLAWPGDHPEPKFQHYGVSVWTLATALDRSLGEVDTGLVDYARPDARGGSVQWVFYPGGKARLLRAVLADGKAGQPVPGLDGLTVFAPVSAGSFSLIAQRPEGDPDAAPTLAVLAP